MRRPDSSGLVYSTELGRMCPACGKALDACICKKAASSVNKGDGVVRVGRETKGRGGKVVTLVRGLPLEAPALVLLGKDLRTACGCGGTVKEGVIEFQGDHVLRVIELLGKKGWRAKQAGG